MSDSFPSKKEVKGIFMQLDLESVKDKVKLLKQTDGEGWAIGNLIEQMLISISEKPETQTLEEVLLPSMVQIPVAQLHKMRSECAMLAALKMAKVEEWQGYKLAAWFNEHDPGIQDIRLGWAVDKKNKERKRQQERENS